MPDTDPGRLHGRYASNYDQLARDYHCYAAEVLFGLAYAAVSPGERLLDAGIGTGLGAAPFAKAGLVIYGLDASEAMLAVCRSKHIAVELKQADLAVTPWPYPPRTFDHVLACGVLHFFQDLDAFFQSVAGVLRDNGTFTFTTKAPPEGGPPVVKVDAGDITVCLHHRDHVAALARRHGFELLKEMRFFVGDDLFDAWVTRLPAAST